MPLLILLGQARQAQLDHCEASHRPKLDFVLEPGYLLNLQLNPVAEDPLAVGGAVFRVGLFPATQGGFVRRAEGWLVCNDFYGVPSAGTPAAV